MINASEHSNVLFTPDSYIKAHHPYLHCNHMYKSPIYNRDLNRVRITNHRKLH